MKAVANFPKEGKIHVTDAPEPTVKSGNDVLVKTLAIGLCGTDHEIAHQDYGTPPVGIDYLIIGHECLGEVVAVGDKVTRFKPGQLVVPRVRRPCDSHDCPACRMGRPDFCLTGDYTERGIVGAHGFMCEKFVDEQQYFHAVPEGMRDFAVLTEPLTIAMKALVQVRDVQDRLPYINKSELKKGDLEGRIAVVLGAGPVGILGALALLNCGAEVFVYSRELEPNANASIIQAAGGEYVSSETVTPDQFREMTGPVNIMYEATGASQFAFEMTELLGRNGIFVLTGVPGRKGPVSISTDKIMRNMVLKNQLLIGTVNAGAPAYEAAIKTLGDIHRRWPDCVGKIITNVVTPEEVGKELIGNKTGIKEIVKFQ